MKDEIKEILDMLEAMASNDDIAFLPKQASLLLDYITNLQNENMKYDQCLTELTDNYKDLQKELTNLQEENERLKGAIETIKETNKLLIQQKAQLQDDLDMLDKRNEKAIEYINHITDELTVDFWNDKTDGAFEDLLNILQGSDE